MAPLPAYSNDEPTLKSNKRSTNTRNSKHLWVFATVATVLFFYLANPFADLEIPSISSIFGQTPCHNIMTHDATGWHTRATPHEGSFEPTKADIVFTALLNSRVEPEGFTLALVKPDLAVDARGKVLTVPEADFEAISSLAKATGDLPKTGAFMGQWRIKHDRTGYPIDRLQVAGQDEVSVYGWDKNTDVLQTKVGDLEKLPEELQTLFGWINEAKTGYVRGEKDEGPIRKVLDAA